MFVSKKKLEGIECGLRYFQKRVDELSAQIKVLECPHETETVSCIQRIFDGDFIIYTCEDCKHRRSVRWCDIPPNEQKVLLKNRIVPSGWDVTNIKNKPYKETK